MLVAVAASAPAAAVRASPNAPYPWPDYSVVPVLFVPRDWSIEGDEVQAEASALSSAMTGIQSFYAKENNGLTFDLNDLEVVQAEGLKEAYHIIWNGRNIYEDGIEFDGNMEAAVVDELHRRGFSTPPNQDETGYSTLIFVKGAGGFAGGRAFGGANGGWAILGDWAIDSIDGTVPEGAYWWSGRRLQVGAAAHELGHTFDLPHPDAYGFPFESTIMGTWWDFPASGLNGWERDHLASVKGAFFQTRLPVLSEAHDETADAAEASFGAVARGTVSSISVDDGRSLTVRSTRGTQPTAGVIASFADVSDELTSLTVRYTASASRPVAVSLEVWNGRMSSWDQLDERTIGHRDVAVEASFGPLASLSDYVIGIEPTGEVQARVRAVGDRRFDLRTDLLEVTVEVPSP